MMTATQLQDIVRLLSNNCHVRYWLNWNCVGLHDRETLRTMAISLCDINDEGKAIPRTCDDLIEKGFRLEYVDGWPYYLITRSPLVGA